MSFTIGVLGYALDNLGQAEQVAAGNVANDQTPGYTAKTYDFESSLRAAMAGGGTATLTPTTGLSPAPAGTNGNNVDLAHEMVDMSGYQVQAQAGVRRSFHPVPDPERRHGSLRWWHAVSTFGVLPIAGSGLNVDQTWLDTIGGNIANANDQSTPGKPVYRPEYIDAVPTAPGGPGAGVGVGAIALGSAKGVLQYDPSNPKANKAGYIARPAVDMATEMVGLEAAQANYQANAAVVRDAMNAYDAILAIKG